MVTRVVSWASLVAQMVKNLPAVAGFSEMHGGVSAPSYCAFIHRVAFEELFSSVEFSRLVVSNSLCLCDSMNRSTPGLPAEKALATHSSTLAWRIPWMEEPGGLQSMGSQRVGHN